MTLKINNLEIENIKRVKAVRLEPTQNGLTVIGGRNAQGKTSVLDAIAWALGGDKFKPLDVSHEVILALARTLGRVRCRRPASAISARCFTG